MKQPTEQFRKYAVKSNAAKKEAFKQEKRKWKKEREEFFVKKRNESQADSRHPKHKKITDQQPLPTGNTQLMPLNKFIAHCGISSRRDAANLVKDGKVKVN